MNFLGLRSNQTAASEQPPAQVIQAETKYASKHGTTLEGFIAEDPFTQTILAKKWNGDTENGTFVDSKDNSHVGGNHLDVTEDEGWIAIPNKELLDNWSEASNMRAFYTLDHSFVFSVAEVKKGCSGFGFLLAGSRLLGPPPPTSPPLVLTNLRTELVELSFEVRSLRKKLKASTEGHLVQDIN